MSAIFGDITSLDLLNLDVMMWESAVEGPQPQKRFRVSGTTSFKLNVIVADSQNRERVSGTTVLITSSSSNNFFLVF